LGVRIADPHRRAAASRRRRPHLEGYAPLKLGGKSQGLEALSKDLASRFSKTRAPAEVPATP